MARFSKGHFEAIAETMQLAYPVKSEAYYIRENQWRGTCEHLADLFAADSPKFNRARFIAACRPGANVKAKRP